MAETGLSRSRRRARRGLWITSSVFAILFIASLALLTLPSHGHGHGSPGPPPAGSVSASYAASLSGSPIPQTTVTQYVTLQSTNTGTDWTGTVGAVGAIVSALGAVASAVIAAAAFRKRHEEAPVKATGNAA